ncbi:MAG: hypothetical protein MMC23_001351 [Stictis urceolatum]|nr:hypothetical protein [Stictis urceolata]
MHIPATSAITCLILALFACYATASAIERSSANGKPLAPRAAQISCSEYSTLANLTYIGLNSTFRAAFIQASRDGTVKSSAILDDAAKKYNQLKLINDTVLNDNKTCRNLSAVAIAEAPKNFSRGVVGPFKISEGIRHGAGIGFAAVLTSTMVGATLLWL